MGTKCLFQVILFFLVINITCFRAWGTVLLPSYGFELCDSRNQGDETCRPKMTVEVVLHTSSAGDVELMVDVADNVTLEDKYGRKWKVDEPVKITFGIHDLRLRTPLSNVNTFQTAYETTEIVRESCDLCCPIEDTRMFREHQFHLNDTRLTYQDMRGSYISYQIHINVTQGDRTDTIILDPHQRPQVNRGYLEALFLMHSTPNNNLADFSSYYLVREEKNLNSEGILVPRNLFRRLPNHLTMDEATYRNSFHCGLDPISVDGGSVYDQLSVFRDQSVSYFIPTCTLLEADEANYDMTCQNMGVGRFLLIMDFSEIKMRRLFGEPRVLAHSVIPSHPSDTHINGYVDIANEGEYPAVIQVAPSSCCRSNSLSSPSSSSRQLEECPDPSDLLERSITHSIDPYETTRFRFPVLRDAMEGNRLTCNMTVVQHGVIEGHVMLTLIDHAVNNNNNDNGGDADGEQDEEGSGVYVDGYVLEAGDTCPEEGRIVRRNDVRYCEPGCTRDEVVEPRDRRCYPVDCQNKYGGLRDFFNEDTHRCEAVVSCRADEVYSPIQNKCFPRSHNPDPIDNGTNPGNPAFSSSSASSSFEWPEFTDESQDYDLDCGEHGTVWSDGSTCKCDEGYHTVTDEADGTVLWCSKKVSTGLSSPASMSSATGMIVGIGAALLGTPVCLCGVTATTVCCIRRRRRKKAAKREEEEAEEGEVGEHRKLPQRKKSNHRPGSKKTQRSHRRSQYSHSPSMKLGLRAKGL
eukprot:gb/GECH01010596.1/.p1 GENE.gb/GECH01010596.1/~~gb/GECH01010596.1/.p1  ORF type:complete len:746 (+),score=115.48 gb/GECH01010596.1/:1-2238(+)